MLKCHTGPRYNDTWFNIVFEICTSDHYVWTKGNYNNLWLLTEQFWLVLTVILAPLQRSWKGCILVSLCPSLRPSVRPFVCPSMDRIMSARNLQPYSLDLFRIYASHQAKMCRVFYCFFISRFVKLKFWEFVTLALTWFWVGIQYEPIVWVIMGRREISSERRRSSCSNLVFLVALR